MLSPKRTKFRKMQKGNNRGIATSGSDVSFGDFGLQAAEPAHPAQHAQLTALQRVPGLSDDRRSRQRGPHRHVSVTTRTRRPEA